MNKALRLSPLHYGYLINLLILTIDDSTMSSGNLCPLAVFIMARVQTAVGLCVSAAV